MDRQSIIAALQAHQAELNRQGVLHAALLDLWRAVMQAPTATTTS
jgi:hypothetical protein